VYVSRLTLAYYAVKSFPEQTTHLADFQTDVAKRHMNGNFWKHLWLVNLDFLYRWYNFWLAALVFTWPATQNRGGLCEDRRSEIADSASSENAAATVPVTASAYQYKAARSVVA